MKPLGLTLITLSFLAGSYLTSLDALEVNWTLFLIALGGGLAGVILVQIAERQLARADDKIASNISSLSTSLDNLVRNITELNAKKDDINTYDVRHKIDELLLDDLNTFAEARESISHKHGLQAYADIMSDFAGGERYLNRIWSASADGYIDEVNLYLGKAEYQFLEAQKKLRAATEKQPVTH